MYIHNSFKNFFSISYCRVSSQEDNEMMSLLTPEKAGCMTISDVVEATKTDVENGLSHEEISQRRNYHGFNEFEITKEEPLWKKYLGEVMILLIYYIFAIS